MQNLESHYQDLQRFCEEYSIFSKYKVSDLDADCRCSSVTLAGNFGLYPVHSNFNKVMKQGHTHALTRKKSERPFLHFITLSFRVRVNRQAFNPSTNPTNPQDILRSFKMHESNAFLKTI